MAQCPKCHENTLTQSARTDSCPCGYYEYYPDAYAGDGLEDPLDYIPLEDRKDD